MTATFICLECGHKYEAKDLSDWSFNEAGTKTRTQAIRQDEVPLYCGWCGDEPEEDEFGLEDEESTYDPEGFLVGLPLDIRQLVQTQYDLAQYKSLYY